MFPTSHALVDFSLHCSGMLLFLWVTDGISLLACIACFQFFLCDLIWWSQTAPANLCNHGNTLVKSTVETRKPTFTHKSKILQKKKKKKEKLKKKKKSDHGAQLFYFYSLHFHTISVLSNPHRFQDRLVTLAPTHLRGIFNHLYFGSLHAAFPKSWDWFQLLGAHCPWLM